MKIVVEVNFDDLLSRSWSGAKDTLQEVARQGRADEVMDYLEMIFEGQTPSETEVNDFIWFELADAIGLYDDDE